MDKVPLQSPSGQTLPQPASSRGEEGVQRVELQSDCADSEGTARRWK